jgi:hypothetical protein
MTISRSARRRAGLALRLLLLAAAAGPLSCGGTALSPVRGRVFYEGQPAKGAVVFFHPRGEGGSCETGPGVVRPMGKVGPDGWFELTTDSRGKGAPPGRYVVTVVWEGPSPAGDDGGPNLVPPHYMSPATSPLIVEVKEGPNDLTPFFLTR